MGAVGARLDANPGTSMVVIGFSGHCATCAGGYAGPGQAAAWTAAAQQLVDVVRAHGKTPVWVTAPPVAPELPIASSVAVIADAGTAVAAPTAS
ncbi:MAG: hypothetical protein U0W40_16930 [Acidimicrobiia bacterium]